MKPFSKVAAAPRIQIPARTLGPRIPAVMSKKLDNTGEEKHAVAAAPQPVHPSLLCPRCNQRSGNCLCTISSPSRAK